MTNNALKKSFFSGMKNLTRNKIILNINLSRMVKVVLYS